MDIIHFFFPEFSFEDWLASVTKAVQQADFSWTEPASTWMFWASLPFLGFSLLHLVGRFIGWRISKAAGTESSLSKGMSRLNRISFVAGCLGAILIGGAYIVDYVYSPEVIQAES